MWMVQMTQCEPKTDTKITRLVDDEMKVNTCETESCYAPKQRLELIRSSIQFIWHRTLRNSNVPRQDLKKSEFEPPSESPHGQHWHQQSNRQTYPDGRIPGVVSRERGVVDGHRNIATNCLNENTRRSTFTTADIRLTSAINQIQGSY